MALINIDLEEGETLVYSKIANHIKGFESVGGKFFLTNKRIAFRSHIFNIQTHLDSIPLDSIIDITFFKTLGLIPNGMKIHTKDGNTEKFVISKRKIAKAEIEKQQLKYSNK